MNKEQLSGGYTPEQEEKIAGLRASAKIHITEIEQDFLPMSQHSGDANEIKKDKQMLEEWRSVLVMLDSGTVTFADGEIVLPPMPVASAFEAQYRQDNEDLRRGRVETQK